MFLSFASMNKLLIFPLSLLCTSCMYFGKKQDHYLATSTTGQVIEHQYFSLSYSEEHEQAEWVAYELTREMAQGQLPRYNRYQVDEEVLTGSAENADYRKSGYDRGHLVPAGDMKFDRDALDETFYFSNMSPQRHDFNSGVWNRLEIQVRRWAIEHEHLYVVTGPVLNSPIAQIGANRVSVASHFYKALLKDAEEGHKVIAFLLPHQQMAEELQSFALPIDELEELTSIDFFPSFSDSLMEKVESEVELSPWFSTGYTTPQAPKELPQITAFQARNYINQECKVCGTVVDTYASKEITQLNFEKAYPDQPFKAVIFREYRKNFKYDAASFLKGKRICVSGKVQLYKQKPQILLRGSWQLAFLE